MKKTSAYESDVQKISVLADALPYIKKFSGKIIVVKYGGNAMMDQTMKESFAYDVAMLKYVGIKPIVVHGGGPDIDKMMKSLNQPIEKRNGMRITTKDAIETVEMVLSGKINRQIVSMLCKQGIKAAGLSGRDANLIEADFIDQESLGYVGDVQRINIELLETLIQQDFVPVITPIAVGQDNQVFNVNADLVAGKLASAMCCEKLILMTNTLGILSQAGDLFSRLTSDQLVELIADKTIKGGMLPKVRCSLDAIEKGVQAVHVLDGRIKHALLLELFTDQGIGTLIKI